MSWQPLTDILPVVDAGAERAAIVASGGTPPALQVMGALTDGLTHAGLAGPSEPAQLFRRGPSAQEAAEAEQAARAAEQAKVQERQAAYEEGMAMARAEGEALALRYRGAIEELAVAREAVIKASEADLVRLALAIAREVLMADVPGREAFAQKMAENAIQLLQGCPAVTLRMNAKDAASLRQHKPELLRAHDVQLVEDDALQAGGVVAEAAKGRVDASIDARLRALADKLLAAGGEAS